MRNTQALFRVAKAAGVKRVVHISITNPSEDSPLEYFRGKARLERDLTESGLSYAILRPTVLFGKEDILVNNIAWALRYLPVMGIFGDGRYKLQPIYVDDLARLAVEQGARTDNVIIDAIGPETFAYRGLVETVGEIIGRRRPIVSVPPGVGYLVGWAIGKLVGDVMITLLAALLGGVALREDALQIAARIAAPVSAVTVSGKRRKRDTVCIETPAAAVMATALSVFTLTPPAPDMPIFVFPSSERTSVASVETFCSARGLERKPSIARGWERPCVDASVGC